MGIFDLFRKSEHPESAPRPGTYEVTFQAALACAQQGQHAGAKALFARVADGVPEEGDACHMLGVEHFGADWGEAAKWFEESLRRPYLAPQLRSASLALLARCYVELGRRSEARSCIDMLRAAMPDLAAELSKQL